jgi:hypothetical protein
MERVTQARPKAEWMWLCLCSGAYLMALLLTGCGGADADSGGRFNLPSGGGGAGGSGGSSGADAAGEGGTSGAGSFGNPDGGPLVYDGGTIDSGSGDPDEIDCGGTAVEPVIMMETIPGNVLLVFDRSGSMDYDFSETDGRARWEVAREAVFNAIEPLKGVVNVAAIFFPHTPSCSEDDSCCVPELGTAPQIDFMPGTDFLAAWDTFWNTAPPVDGSTPTLEALQVAGNALAARAGTLTGTTTVVLITDGDPRCALDLGNFGNDNPTPEQITDRVTRLSELPAQLLVEGIATHVLGLPGTEAPHAVTVLNGIAAAGGTTQHISAADPMLLQNEIAAIVGESVTTSFDSCSIGLPHQPPNVDDVVLVVVEGGREQSVARDLGTGGGWTLVGTGADMSIILQGELCNQARAGAYDKISVVFGCIELPPLEPPKGPD